MITYQKEWFETVYDLAQDHIQNNLEENMQFKDKLQPGIDYFLYDTMENHCLLVVYTARDENTIIGYAVFLIGPTTHYINGKQAVNDALYVDPKHRGTDVAFNLLKFAEEELKASGVHVMYVCFKKPNELVNKLEYSLEEYKYTKYIGE